MPGPAEEPDNPICDFCCAAPGVYYFTVAPYEVAPRANDQLVTVNSTTGEVSAPFDAWHSGTRYYACPACSNCVRHGDRATLLDRSTPRDIGHATHVIAVLHEAFWANLRSGPHPAAHSPSPAQPATPAPAPAIQPYGERHGWLGLPHPDRICAWRDKLAAYHSSDEAILSAGMALAAGHGTLWPACAEGVFTAAAVMSAQEHHRLASAALWGVSDEMCAVALRRATRPRRAPFRFDRIPGWAPTDGSKPTKYGHIVFAHPIGLAYGPDGPVPIVAASWGPWNADFAPLDPSPVPHPIIADTTSFTGPAWVTRPEGALLRPEDGMERLWITFYAHSTLRGFQPPLEWYDEAVVTDNDLDLGRDPLGGTTESWLSVLISAFELMTQHQIREDVRLADYHVHQRAPKDRRRDSRRGITTPADVRIAHLYAPARATRRIKPTGSRTYTCSWMVEEHERNQCPNPHQHTALGGARTAENPTGRCEHYPITILDHFVDTGMPFRPKPTKLTMWDRMPPGDGGS